MFKLIIETAVRHRWLVVFMAALIAAVGLFQLGKLPIDAVPDITNRQVQINTVAPALTPEQIERQVTYPLETALAGIPGLTTTRSLSRNGFSQVTAIFTDATDIYFARQQVAERLQQARSQIPDGLDPQLGPIATGLGEIFMYTIDADPDARKADGSPYTATDLRTLQDWVIRPQLRNVPGVTEVNTIGGFQRQVHITPDPAKLRALGFTLEDVAAAVEANNQNVGAGYIERNGQQFLVRVPGQVADLEQIGNIVLDRREGVPIHVHDVATVADGPELRSGAAT